MKKDLKLIRIEDFNSGCIGILLINGYIFCYTLENGLDERYRIPEGIYELKRFNGTKYKNTFEIIVPDHSALLFHNGNSENNTDGCVLLGEYPGYIEGKRAIMNSRLTFNGFKTAMKDFTEGTIMIINLKLGGQENADLHQ